MKSKYYLGKNPTKHTAKLKKRCIDCKRMRDRKFYAVSKGRNGDGRNGACNECMKTRMYAWIKNNYDKYREYQNKYKREAYAKLKKAVTK